MLGKGHSYRDHGTVRADVDVYIQWFHVEREEVAGEAEDQVVVVEAGEAALLEQHQADRAIVEELLDLLTNRPHIPAVVRPLLIQYLAVPQFAVRPIAPEAEDR